MREAPQQVEGEVAGIAHRLAEIGIESAEAAAAAATAADAVARAAKSGESNLTSVSRKNPTLKGLYQKAVAVGWLQDSENAQLQDSENIYLSVLQQCDNM